MQHNQFFCKHIVHTCWLAFVFISTTTPSQAEVETNVWDAFNNGKAIALMRHAIAPGNGDPVDFQLGDCQTQRNLSKEGELQAQRIGLRFKEHGTRQSNVYSSQWCRCVDTAVNLKLGSVEQIPMLNSFYQDRSTEAAQTTRLKQWIVNRLASIASDAVPDQEKTEPAILVTHQVNITALTGVFPTSGEVVFVAMDSDRLIVLGTWLAEI